MVAPRGLLGEGLVESVRSVLKRSCGPRAFEEATYKPGELLFRSVHKRLSIAHGRFGRALGLLLNHGGSALGFGSNRLGITLGFDPQLLDADKRTTDRVVLRAELVELTLERLNAVEQLIAFGRQRAIALFNAGEKSVGGGSVVASKRRRKFVLGTQADSPRVRMPAVVLSPLWPSGKPSDTWIWRIGQSPTRYSRPSEPSAHARKHVRRGREGGRPASAKAHSPRPSPWSCFSLRSVSRSGEAQPTPP